MKRWLGSWRALLVGILLGVCGPAWSQTAEVDYVGFVCNSKETLGILRTPSDFRIVKRGDSLGDYKVTSVNFDAITLSLSGSPHSYPLKSDTQAWSPPSGEQVFVSAQWVEVKHLALALARLAAKPIVIHSLVGSPVNSSGSFENPEMALRSTLERVPETHAGKVELCDIHDLWVVAPKDLKAEFWRTLGRSSHRGPALSLDFVNADLVYVITLLAKEMKVNLFVGDTVGGAVNIWAREVPAEDLLAAALGAQEESYGYHLDHQILAVADRLLVAHPPPKLDRGGPSATMFPEGFNDKFDTPQTSLLEFVEQLSGQLNTRLTGTVSDSNLVLRMKDCPASLALYWGLRVHGYDAFATSDGQATLLRTPGHTRLRVDLSADHESGLRTVEEELQESVRHRGEQHQDTGRLLALKGDVLYWAEHYTAAIESYVKALEILNSTPAKDDTETFQTHHRLWMAYRLSGDKEKAADERHFFISKWDKTSDGRRVREWLLEYAPAYPVYEYLREQYPEVTFYVHPTMNGFFVHGPKESLLSIRRELQYLDREMPVE